MLKLKKNTIKMKSYLLNDFKLNNVIEILASNWLLKKNTGRGVSNYLINRITNKLYKYGAEAVKISGAGGGGFILVVTPTENIFYLKKNLKLKNAIFYNFGFEPKGAQSWTVK
jgi:D-glycero-alpha-D-manno-heptose-7-phosphate kinase